MTEALSMDVPSMDVLNMEALILPDAAATAALGRDLARHVRAGDVVTLSGPLGAGKTSFARGLLAGLGFDGDAPSPSYPLVILYDPPEVRVPIAHVDLYRLESPAEVDELGLDELLDGAAMLVEWPERAGADRWPEALRLVFTIDGDGRRLTWDAPAAWKNRWLPDRR